ncbi:MAG TPA: transporter [Caulobacteraceae bacterium]|nr:transporter [Caulobacteraceae bacterium]
MRHWFFAAGLLAIGSPAWADHPVVTGVGNDGATLNVASPDTLEAGRASAGVRLTFTRPEQRSDAELAAFAGRHVHAHNSDYLLNAVVGASYGLTDRLTLSAELPYRRHEGLRAGEHSHGGGGVTNDVVELGGVAGVGDVSVMAKYRLLDGGVRLALIGGLKLPTGSTDEHNDQGERLETEHQPGSGSWDPIAGAAMATDLGALTLTASGLYQFAGEGAQDTELGDRAQVGVALSRRIGPEHHEDAPGDEHGHASFDLFLELTGEWEGRQRIAGETEPDSGGKAVWLSPGARFNSAGGWSLAAAVGLPVWQDIGLSHPDNDYRLTVALGRAF